MWATKKVNTCETDMFRKKIILKNIEIYTVLVCPACDCQINESITWQSCWELFWMYRESLGSWAIVISLHQALLKNLRHCTWSDFLELVINLVLVWVFLLWKILFRFRGVHHSHWHWIFCICFALNFAVGDDAVYYKKVRMKWCFSTHASCGKCFYVYSALCVWGLLAWEDSAVSILCMCIFVQGCE